MSNRQFQKIAGEHQVQYYSASESRTPPVENVLEDRFLHKLFLTANIPGSWKVWQLAGGLLLVTAAVWLFLQWSVASLAGVAATLYLLFALGDWLLFWWLPRTRRSFGPVGSQLFVSTVPRVGAIILSIFIAAISGLPMVGLLALILLQLIGTICYVWGGLIQPFALAVTEQTVKMANLPAGFPPLRLLHLSDLHMERLTSRESHLLSLVEQSQPDLIVITGDYLNLSYVDDPTARADARKILSRLAAPYGVYATLGSPPVDPRSTTPSLFDGLNIRLLRDELAVISLPDDRKLSLLGLDCEHDLESDTSAFSNLIQRVPANSAQVLLYHSPELMPLVQQYPIDLYLCGHTHGGQFRVPGYGALLTSSITGKQYEMGRYIEQETTLYISRGIGLEGLSAPRMRMFCPPEIILFTIAGADG